MCIHWTLVLLDDGLPVEYSNTELGSGELSRPIFHSIQMALSDRLESKIGALLCKVHNSPDPTRSSLWQCFICESLYKDTSSGCRSRYKELPQISPLCCGRRSLGNDVSSLFHWNLQVTFFLGFKRLLTGNTGNRCFVEMCLCNSGTRFRILIRV